MAFCSGCGTQIPDGASLCPACAAKAPAVPAVSSGGGLTDNVAGMLAYITIIPAIIFLVMEPYNKAKFVRFHAFQSIFFHVAIIIAWFVMMILAIIPILGWLIDFVVVIGIFVLWVVLLIKANQGQMFKLPVIGDLAEKQAGA